MRESVKDAQQGAQRFVLIDALRAFAALWVAVHHLYYRNVALSGAHPLPEPVHTLFRQGWLGVSVFFVLSGFVIMHSLRSATITPRYIGRFALRRSLRLDPPYWLALAGMIVLNLVSSALSNETSIPPPPRVANVVAHLFYAQRFFGFDHIVGVFWTLCYEIQFYLLLVAGLGLSTRLGKNGRYIVFGLLWAFCMCCAVEWIPLTHALSFSRWPLFFLGALVYWAFIEKSVPIWLACAIGALTIAPFVWRLDEAWLLEVGVALATATLIGVGARRGFLATLSLGPVVQFLGRISYSIYLLHMVVGSRAVHLVMRYYGHSLTPMQDVVAVVAGLLVTVGVSYVNYRLVEKPAHSLSRRISMDTQTPMWQRVRGAEPTADLNAA